MKKKGKILFIISGSIAAEKALKAAEILSKNYEITFVLTKNAEEFVSYKTAEKISGGKIYRELFASKGADKMDHINLSRENDLILVAPASANLLAKIAWGIADSLASTILLAANKPVMLAPAMNTKMWENKATQRNIKQLKNDGIIFIGPASGDLACGEFGEGRMKEASEIAERVDNFFASRNFLKGIKILITAGPTMENIDPVRFISNHSSGKQGYALAEVFSEMGAEVTLVSGPVNIFPPANVKIINVKTADEMLAAVKKNQKVAVAVFTAAVADWKIKKPHKNKIKKSNSELKLKLIKNPDILAGIYSKKQRPSLVIGFAAETEKLLKNAGKKLKKADWILANDVSHAFGSDKNKVSFITKGKIENWPEISKHEVAIKLARKIKEFYDKGKNKKTG